MPMVQMRICTRRWVVAQRVMPWRWIAVVRRRVLCWRRVVPHRVRIPRRMLLRRQMVGVLRMVRIGVRMLRPVAWRWLRLRVSSLVLDRRPLHERVLLLMLPMVRLLM